MTMHRRLEFTGPGRVAVKAAAVPRPAAGEVVVQARLSAVSPGTEMLVYRDEWPPGVPLDATLDSLTGAFAYPLSYGYCSVGRVIEAGEGVAADWAGRRVFAFHPHQDRFCTTTAALEPIPDDIDDENALFLPTMETAVTLLLDGAPLLGEHVAVVGQGVVGLLATALLSRFPLASLTGVEPHPLRREAALRFGAAACFDPADPELSIRLGVRPGQGGKADLVYELSGAPAGLNTALALARFSGRVVVGSWYGAKPAAAEFGSFFHRGRLSVISSQVSTIAPRLTGRWQNRRRLDTAWEMVRRVRPSACITQRFPFAEAPAAYALIDRAPEQTIQVIFEYRAGGEA